MFRLVHSLTTIPASFYRRGNQQQKFTAWLADKVTQADPRHTSRESVPPASLSTAETQQRFWVGHPGLRCACARVRHGLAPSFGAPQRQLRSLALRPSVKSGLIRQSAVFLERWPRSPDRFIFFAFILPRYAADIYDPGTTHTIRLPLVRRVCMKGP